MRVLLCIDDTDDLESPGTGQLADRLRSILETKGLARCSYVTRHQLFVHPAIPYTSHNSAMCFEADATASRDDLVLACAQFLRAVAPPAADPGLCVVDVDLLRDPASLACFGRRAKREVLDKQMAYRLAHALGVHLSEHGGTGQGVIGALAGAGLRLDGNDGRLRGALELGAEALSVARLLQHPHVEAVCTARGEALPPDAQVRLVGKVKTVRRGGKAVLLAAREGTGGWRNCSKEELEGY